MTQTYASSTRRCATASRRPASRWTSEGKLRIAQALAAPQGRRHRGGIRRRFAGRCRSRSRPSRRDRGADHLLARPRQPRRHRRRRHAPGGGAAQAHPRLPRHQPDPSRGQAAHEPRRGARGDPRLRSPSRASIVDDVEFSAEDAIRTERDFLVECLSVAAESRRVHAQRSRHGRLHHARGDLRRSSASSASRSTRPAETSSSRPIAMTISAWRSPTRSPRCAAARARSNARSTASANAPAIARSRTSSWRCSTRADHLRRLDRRRHDQDHGRQPHAGAGHQCAPPRNKAIVGVNAFAHEAGIHQHGVLQNRETYEIMKPEDIGLSTDGIVLGKHSAAATRSLLRARELGFSLEGEALDARVPRLQAGRRRGRHRRQRPAGRPAGRPRATGRTIAAGRSPSSRSARPRPPSAWPVARVELEHGERGRVTDIASAPGALDAIFTSISQIMDVPARVDALELQYVAADPDEAPEDGQGAKVLVEIALDVGRRDLQPAAPATATSCPAASPPTSTRRAMPRPFSS